MPGVDPGSSPKLHFDGTHRALPPELTWRFIKPHLASLGITRVAVITGLDVVGIPVVMVARPNARSLSVSQGKGIDLCCAKVSGAMESIEQHCAEHLDLSLRYGSWRELRARIAMLDPAELPCFDREPARTTCTLWVEGRSLSTGEPCHVPYALVHLDLRRPLTPGSELFPLSSNGLASGNTRSEALVHGLLELIERDAWARFMELAPEEREGRRLRLDSVSAARPLELLQKLARAGLSTAVWDMTSPLGVACFLCQIVETESDWAFRTGRAEGAGCHTDREVALVRALCEAAQSRLCAISGARDDMTRASVARIRAPGSVQRAQQDLSQSLVLGCRFERIPTQRFASFGLELAWLLEVLRSRADSQVVAVDLPTHGVPVSVVRVVASALRPPHFVSDKPPRASMGAEQRV